METHDTHQHGARQSDRPTSHGMLVVGETTVFLSHLPMFMSLHDYQAILEVDFTGSGIDPENVYFNDRKKNAKQRIYTFEPTRAFVLPDLFPTGHDHSPGPKTIEGNLYRGHFERFPSAGAKEQARIATNVVATVKNVVHAHKFDPAAKQLDQLEYILFGQGQELFLAHLITRPPDFDQVLSVSIGGQQLTGEQLSRGLTLRVPGRANVAKERIKEKDVPVSAVIQIEGKSIPVEIAPKIEFYLEEGELEAQM